MMTAQVVTNNNISFTRGDLSPQATTPSSYYLSLYNVSFATNVTAFDAISGTITIQSNTTTNATYVTNFYMVPCLLDINTTNSMSTLTYDFNATGTASTYQTQINVTDQTAAAGIQQLFDLNDYTITVTLRKNIETPINVTM